MGIPRSYRLSYREMWRRTERIKRGGKIPSYIPRRGEERPTNKCIAEGGGVVDYSKELW